MFHREQVVARRDAGPALVNDSTCRVAAQELRELAFKHLRRLETSVGPEVGFEKTIERARYMPRDGVERFVFPPEPIGAACVEHGDCAIAEMSRHKAAIHCELGLSACREGSRNE